MIRSKDSFQALQIRETEGGTQTVISEFTNADLPAGDVMVDISYSDLNFKDGKVMEPGSRIAQYFPIIPGIDFVGVVTHSTNPLFTVGDRVVANGFGLGTDRDGGLAQRTCVPGSWLFRLPSQIEERHAAAIGTAGYTAALAVDTLLGTGLHPSAGPVLVTGAGGGFGSIVTMLLADAGFEVVASTGRMTELKDSLKMLGASRIVGRLSIDDTTFLNAPMWSAVVDSVGSKTLASALASTRYGGPVVTVGLAQGIDLPTTVLPFILRGVSLHGIDSVYASQERRQQAWKRLATTNWALLDSVTTIIGLNEAVKISQDIVRGKVHGRIVVDVHKKE